MIDHGLAISICTDNRLVSNTTVSREVQLVLESAKLTPAELRRLIVAGFKGAFFHGSFAEKRRFVESVERRYDALAAPKPATR